jgi:dipeptide/tripeptide permease
MVGDVGAVLGPIVAGLVAERVGYEVAFATIAMIAVVSFVGWWRTPATTLR